MIEEDHLKDLLHQQNISQQDTLLLCLGVNVNSPKQVRDIKSLAHNAGLRKVKNWNVSMILKRTDGLAIRTNNGWELTSKGKKRVVTLAGSVINTPIQKIATELRVHLLKINNEQTLAFLDEAIKCYEIKLYRAAVVLTWIGAVSVLYDHVLNNKLNEFNTEAKRRNSKWKTAKNKDDLAQMKEYDFLQNIKAISVIGKSVKDELEICLKFRNGCGHPNSLKAGEARVSAHIETLILNIFSVFSH